MLPTHKFNISCNVFNVNISYNIKPTHLIHSMAILDISRKRMVSHIIYSTAAKGCFWEMTPTGSITRYHLFFLIEDIMGYVKSVVVEK